MRRSRTLNSVLLLAFLSSLAACSPGASLMQSARTLAPGVYRADTHVYFFPIRYSEEFPYLPMPAASLGLRYGVAPRCDVGFSVGTEGLSADVKAQLVETPRVAIAVAP